MKIIRNNIIPFPGFKCINLFGILFVRKNANLDQVTITHEEIHTKQMKELLYIFFYFLYVFEFFVHFIKIKKWKEAYHEISFEREAYAYEEYPNYPEIRNHYYWFKYW